jgi:hypothetical protein
LFCVIFPHNIGVGITENNPVLPNNYRLHQNYPNPFNPTTKIKFDLPLQRGVGGMTTLVIYDITGREISTLISEQLQPGTYETTWDASSFPSGIYFYKMEIRNGDEFFSDVKRMILVK